MKAEDKEKVVEEFLVFVKHNTNILQMLTGFMDEEAIKQMNQYLNNQKNIFINSLKEIEADL